MDGKLSTAFAMDEQTVAQIAEKFTERMGTQIHLRQEVDPSIIAGFVVQIGFLRFDYSARARLKELTSHMLSEA